MSQEYHNYDTDETLTLDEEFHFELRGEKYVLYQANGEDGTQYKNELFRRTKMKDGEISGFVDLSYADLYLLSLVVKYDGKPRAEADGVPMETIKGFPYPVIKDLVKRAKDIGDIDDESPQWNALQEAMSLEDAPIKLPVFKDWLNSLPLSEDRFKPLKPWAKSKTDKIKN